MDGGCQELAAGRYHHLATTFLGTLVDGLLNGLLVLGSGGVGLGTIFGDQIHLVCKLRLTDTLFYLLVLGLVPILGMSYRWHQQTEHQNLKNFSHHSYLVI